MATKVIRNKAITIDGVIVHPGEKKPLI